MAKRKKQRRSEDPWEGFWEAPENQEWVQHVKEELVPMIRRSAVTVSLVPNDPRDVDLKFAVELGLSVMLDKPIIAVIAPGVQVPNQLLRLAARIIEWDGEPTDASRQALIDAIQEVGGDD